MKTDSQNAQILRHLKRGKSLTALEAVRQFDCLRLAGRIFELKEAGHRIHTAMIKTPSAKRVARYTLLAAK